MTRAISTVLAFVFLLLTVCCSPSLIQMRQIKICDAQEQVPVEALRQLKKGMPITIALRNESEIPFKEKKIECIIEEVGPESLTVIPRPGYSAVRDPNMLVIHYAIPATTHPSFPHRFGRERSSRRRFEPQMRCDRRYLAVVIHDPSAISSSATPP